MTPPINIDGTSITGASIDGQTVSEITVDGTRVFSTIPDSVVNQWDAQTFTTGDGALVDQVAANDMTLTGDLQSVSLGGGDGIKSDGTDDRGETQLGTNPEQQTTFGIAITFKIIDSSKLLGRASTSGANGGFWLADGVRGGSNGQIGYNFADDGGDNNAAYVNDTLVNDGNPHFFIFNKNGDSPSNWDYYIDQTASPNSKEIDRDQGYDSSNTSVNEELEFFGFNSNGSIRHTAVNFGVIEFNNQPYSQTEREGFVSRRPEV